MKRNCKKFQLQLFAVSALALALNTGTPSAVRDMLQNAFVPAEVQAAEVSPYSDYIPDWSADVVKEMSDAVVLKGYEDGTFRPNQTMTRMEFLKTAVCAVKS